MRCRSPLLTWPAEQVRTPLKKSLWPTSYIICLIELKREFRVMIRCRLLYLRDRWSRWRGRPWWGACVAGAGWGFGHRGSFSKDRLAWCLRDGIEPEWASRQVPLRWVFFPCSWSSFWVDLALCFVGPNPVNRSERPHLDLFKSHPLIFPPLLQM